MSFDEQYKKNECLWGVKPHPLIERILEFKKSGSIFDIGCGEGRNALFLASRGFDVSGVDISPEAIKKLEESANTSHLSIDASVADIRDYNFTEKFDVMVSIATLHFLPEEDVMKIIAKIKGATKNGGLNVISVFNKNNPGKKFNYLFKLGELKELYSDWKVLGYKEYISEPEKHGDGPMHTHSISQIIAQK